MKFSHYPARRYQNKGFLSPKSHLFDMALSFCAALWIYSKFIGADYTFSYDYQAYLKIFSRISEFSAFNLFVRNFSFPYVSVPGIVTIEFGFAALIKFLSSLGATPEMGVASVASFSLALRVWVMRSLGVPLIWVLLTNMYAVTLLEANALRFGLAASILLLGLRNLYLRHLISAAIAFFSAVFIHIQVLFFIVPFIVFYMFSFAINKSKSGFIAAIAAICIFEVIAVRFIPMINNEKIQDYVALGSSSSAGLTLTSFTAIVVFVIISRFLRHGANRSREENFFSVIISSAVPSLILLVALTEISVIGDRTWQLAFIVIVSFFFIQWCDEIGKKLPSAGLFCLVMISVYNVVFQYRLSNVFSPPLPPFVPYIYG
jgi:hypothetical protein